jgi:hypothetical protein
LDELLSSSKFTDKDEFFHRTSAIFARCASLIATLAPSAALSLEGIAGGIDVLASLKEGDSS